MRLGVGIIITRPDGHLLLGRRVYPNMPECWCLPGGKVDPGESFEAAARRETSEECGLDLAMPAPFALITDTHEGGPWITAALAITLDGDPTPRVMEPDKLAEWRWFQPSALPAPLFPATAAVLAALRGEAVPGVSTYLVTAR